MKRNTIWTMITVVLLLSVVLAGCAQQATEAPVEEPVATDAPPAEEPTAKTWQIAGDKLKVALILDGPVNDGGWNEYTYNGLVKVAEKYGAETAYSESVARADMETVFTDYAARGYNVLIGHGYEFSDAAKTVSANYPEAIFIVTHASDGFVGPNTAGIQFDEEQISFALGVFSGLMTETNKIACLGGYEIPAIAIPFEAFTYGVKEAAPDVEVTVSYLDTWTDVAKMKEAALAAIDGGADIVLPIAVGANAGGYEAIKEKGVWGVGYSGDASAFAPDNVLGSAIIDTGSAIELTIGKIVDGTFEGTNYWYGLKDGVLYFADFHESVPQDVIDQVDAWMEKIQNGEYEVPIKMRF